MDDWGERTWQGAGFTAPMARGQIVADDPGDFRASVRWVQLDHVRVEMMTAGPHRFESSREDLEPIARRAVMTFAIGEGDLDVITERGVMTLHRGDIVLSDDSITGGYHARTPVRLLWSVIGVEHIPAHLLQHDALPAVLPRTRLVNSYVAFLSALMSSRVGEPRGQSTDPYLMQALIDLQLGVLAQRRSTRPMEAGQPDLRRRIEEYVLAHLGEHDLGPTRIAQALGISLRYAHQVFNRDGETLAQYVRDRRLESVAAALRDPSASTRLGDLADRYGFGSRDQLTRAFRRRYGLTMGEYRQREPAEG